MIVCADCLHLQDSTDRPCDNCGSTWVVADDEAVEILDGNGHIEAISNGMGAPSVYMIQLAGEGKIPARLSISAQTGWENDRLWSNGERSTNTEYFEHVIVPLGRKHGIECVLVEALDENGGKVPPLGEWVEQFINSGQLNHIKIPLFGSGGGRLRQPCTQRKKVIAIRQELRRRGAKTARTAHGLHRGEIRRMKGRFGRNKDYYTLTSMDALWHTHYYPLIELRHYRHDIRKELEKEGIPYLLTTECDGCPHQDYMRWMNHTPEVIDHIAGLEAKMDGKFFFTDKRIPLKDALAAMAEEEAEKRRRQSRSLFEDFEDDDPDFGCDEGAVCGV